MRWYGKFIGAFLGSLLGAGLPGVLVGLMLGHLVDSGAMSRWITPIAARYQQTPIQRVFFASTFSIMGYLAKVDGRVTESEIRAAKHIMQHMNLNMTLRQQAINYFTLGKQSDFDWRNQVRALRQACTFHPSLLRTFVEMQLQIVYAEGHVMTSMKREALQRICNELGIKERIYDQFEQQSQAGQRYQQQQQQHRQRQQYTYVDPQQKIVDAYQILGIHAAAGNSEVTKAYRRLMSKHHPDKLVAKGLPPEMLKLATEKTQKIKNAYEIIKKARGI